MPIAIDQRKVQIERLSKVHDTSSFFCGQPALDTFIHEEALKYQEDRSGVTHLFYYKGSLVGFVTLSMTSVKKKIVPEVKQSLISIQSYPALLIGRLAVTKEKQGSGIGRIICEWCHGKALESIEWVGCKFLAVDAKPDVMDFYKKCGFIMLKKQETRDLKMMIKKV